MVDIFFPHRSSFTAVTFQDWMKSHQLVNHMNKADKQRWYSSFFFLFLSFEREIRNKWRDSRPAIHRRRIGEWKRWCSCSMRHWQAMSHEMQMILNHILNGTVSIWTVKRELRNRKDEKLFLCGSFDGLSILLLLLFHRFVVFFFLFTLWFWSF